MNDALSPQPASEPTRAKRPGGSPDRSTVIWNGFQVPGLLLLIYVAAFVWPQPGIEMHRWRVSVSSGNLSISVSHLLLACLLFGAGFVVGNHASARHLRDWKGFTWQLGWTWLAPICCALLLIGPGQWVLPLTAGVSTGLFLIMMMPAANSAVGWTYLLGGELPLSLLLLLGSTLTAPVAGLLLEWLVSTGESRLTPMPSGLGVSAFLSLWVLVPALLGWLFRRGCDQVGISISRIWMKRGLLFSLLGLNYLNASTALPLLKNFDQVWLAMGSVLLLNLLIFTASWQLLRFRGVPAAFAVTTTLSTGMRNTGAALVLTGTLGTVDPWAVATILLYTLTQHCMAGFLMPILIGSREQGAKG